jgi:uncharacterized protein (TIGR02246 family)
LARPVPAGQGNSVSIGLLARFLNGTIAMCFKLLALGAGLAWLLLVKVSMADESAGAAVAAKENPEGEAAIRATVEKFVAAYNAHDVNAISALFLPQAQVVDDEGNTILGRDMIAAEFAAAFEATPETSIAVQIDSIRFIGSALAAETGSTETTVPGQPVEFGRYTVLHVLSEGQWRMGLVRDMPAAPTHRDHLQALSWMVGDWIDQSRSGSVKTSCRWSDDGSCLLQDVTVQPSSGEPLKIHQRIGWDPLTGKFKAWMFDAEGGYGESIWTPTESGWLIKAHSVQSDGSTASATNHIEPTSLDRYIFRSVDRVVGNEMADPVEVIVVRQPPAPADLAGN